MMSHRASRTDRVYQALTNDLVHGKWRPGAAISVKENATRLAVSPTPIREALERLVGEGLVSLSDDRNGFIMPRIGLHGYLSLIDAFALLADSIVRAGRGEDEAILAIAIEADDPIGTTDALFGRVFAAGRNDVTAWLASRLGRMLAPYRAAEPAVIPAWQAEMSALRAGLAMASAGAIRRYVRTRRLNAAQLVDHVERGAASIPNILAI